MRTTNANRFVLISFECVLWFSQSQFIVEVADSLVFVYTESWFVLAVKENAEHEAERLQIVISSWLDSQEYPKHGNNNLMNNDASLIPRE